MRGWQLEYTPQTVRFHQSLSYDNRQRLRGLLQRASRHHHHAAGGGGDDIIHHLTVHVYVRACVE